MSPEETCPAVLRHALEDDGKTVIFVAIDQRPVLLLALADTVKSESAQSIRALRRMGREAGAVALVNMEIGGKKVGCCMEFRIIIDYSFFWGGERWV